MAKPLKYQDARIPSVEEAFDIREKESDAIETEMNEIFGIEDFVEMHKASKEMLDSVNGVIDDYLEAYESGKNGREEVEKIFALKISILQSMGRRFHPLSKYGKKCLTMATDCRKLFEDQVGPMTTSITFNNINLFKAVLSKEIYDDILSGRRLAIGAIRSIGSSVYGAGALVYHWDDVPFNELGVIRIDWLFVHPKFRERGISDHLLGELISRASNIGIEDITAEFPVDSQNRDMLGYVFGAWQFTFETGLTPEAVFRAEDVTGFTKIRANKKGVRPLSSINDDILSKFVRKVLSRYNYRGFLTSQALPSYYIDKDLSCFIISGKDVGAMLLAHKTVGGIIRVEYIGVANDMEMAVINLVSFFLENAILTGDDSSIIMIPVEMEELGEFLEEVCPMQMGHCLLGATLSKPDAQINMTAEDLEKLIAATA